MQNTKTVFEQTWSVFEQELWRHGQSLRVSRCAPEGTKWDFWVSFWNAGNEMGSHLVKNIL